MPSGKGPSSPQKSALKKPTATPPALPVVSSPVPPAGGARVSSAQQPSPIKQRKTTSKVQKFAQGDHVEINYNEEVDIWVHGVVTAVQPESDTYSITYDDGFVDTQVSHIYIRAESRKDVTWSSNSTGASGGDELLNVGVGGGGGGGGGASTESSGEETKALLMQIAALQKTIEELRGAGSREATEAATVSGKTDATSRAATLSDKDILELDLSTLTSAPEQLLQVALSCKYLYIEASEKVKDLQTEKTAWIKKEEQMARAAKVAAKSSEDVVAKLKKEIAELSKKGGSKAAAAAAVAVADDLEKAAKEQAERDAATEELNSTISELQQRLELTVADKKKLDGEFDRISKLYRTSESALSDAKAAVAETKKTLEESLAKGEQTLSLLQVVTKEKDELDKAKKASAKEIQAGKKAQDELKEQLETVRSEVDSLRAASATLQSELKELNALHGIEAKSRSKMLAYFEVGLRCEVLTLIGENKRTAIPSWSSGRITKRNENATFNVFLDDGTSKTELAVESIRVIMNVGTFLLNDRVEILDARSSGGGSQPLAGKISRCNADGSSYLVYCDNGLVDPKVPAEFLRLIVPPIDQSFQVNDAVIVNYQNKNVWFSGVIVGVGGTNPETGAPCFAVQFDFGETDAAVAPATIRTWCSPQATTTNCPMCHALARISRQVDDCKKYIKELQAAHEMATEGAASSNSLENSRLKYLVTNAWAFVLQEGKILNDAVEDMQQFFSTDHAFLTHSALHGEQASGGKTGSLGAKSMLAITPSQHQAQEPISKEKFERLKREKVEEERRRRMVIEEERRQAEKARRLAEENFAGETIRKAATKNDMATLNTLVERWSGDKVLSQGFDNNITAVWAAAERGNIQALELLLSHGASHSVADVYGSTALAEAASNGHDRAVSLLIKSGADVNQPNHDGCTPLYRAVGNGHKGAVALLLKAGADINKPNRTGRTPVGMAAWTGMSECLELLLEKKADVSKADNDKWSPIFAASANNHLECLDLLIRGKADVMQCNSKLQTPLYIAAKNGHISVCAKLIEKAATAGGNNLPNMLNAQDADGETAMFVASQEGHIEVMKLLVERGCDILLANKNGLTPSKIAAQSFQAEAVDMLKKVEAEEMERLRREADNAKRELAEVKSKLASAGADGSVTAKGVKAAGGARK